jgi:hypothetical protein
MFVQNAKYKLGLKEPSNVQQMAGHRVVNDQLITLISDVHDRLLACVYYNYRCKYRVVLKVRTILLLH